MIRIGLIQGVHGVGGDLKIRPLTDFPQRFQKGAVVTLSGKTGTYRLEAAKKRGEIFLIRFDGIGDRDAAAALVGAYLEIPDEAAMPLPEGHFYHFQLLGLEVYENGIRLGEIVEIIESAAHDVYGVQNPAGRRFLLPALKSVVLDVDLEKGRMEVKAPAGLLEAT